MRNIRNEDDIRKYAEFGTRYNNASEGATCDILLRENKSMTKEDFFLMEDPDTGDFLATVCYIPWKVCFDGTLIHVAMLEMVLSHPEHRKRGLVKKLIHHFLAEVDDRGCRLSIITGIPNYYRQYGYTYAIDLGTNEILPVSKIPAYPHSNMGDYCLRKADKNDVPQLVKCYERNTRNKQVFVIRSAAHWHYLIDQAKYDIRIMEETPTKSVLGYYLVNESEDRKTINILEDAMPTVEVTRAALTLLKTDATTVICVGCHQDDLLTQLAKNAGSTTSRSTQWLLKTHDNVQFLRTIQTVLEKRLASTGYHDLTTDVTINLFRYAIRLSIRSGKIESINNIGFVDSSMGADGGDLCIPHDAFIRLLFGYRSLDALWDAWPDIVVKPERKHLLEVLFPILSVSLFAPYHHQGRK